MEIGTVHYRSGGLGQAACGFSHEKGRFTNVWKKVTCPQCLKFEPGIGRGGSKKKKDR